jgi:hypothetical protein
MEELVRQVVAFGDFKSIGFEVINQLNDIIKKYDMVLEATQDFSTRIERGNRVVFEVGVGQPVPTIPQIRPVLVSKTRNFCVFIGASRIHVEERNASADTYEDFLTKAKEIFKDIIDRFSAIVINRIAINGKAVSRDIEKMKKVYSATFKESELYGTESNEFSFRINTIVQSQALNKSMNKIVEVNRVTEIDTNNKQQPSMFIDYDYNTVENIENTFSYDDIELLITEGIELRAKVLQ